MKKSTISITALILSTVYFIVNTILSIPIAIYLPSHILKLLLAPSFIDKLQYFSIAFTSQLIQYIIIILIISLAFKFIFKKSRLNFKNLLTNQNFWLLTSSLFVMKFCLFLLQFNLVLLSFMHPVVLQILMYLFALLILSIYIMIFYSLVSNKNTSLFFNTFKQINKLYFIIIFVLPIIYMLLSLIVQLEFIILFVFAFTVFWIGIKITYILIQIEKENDLKFEQMKLEADKINILKIKYANKKRFVSHLQRENVRHANDQYKRTKMNRYLRGK